MTTDLAADTQPATWAQYHEARSGIAAEMLGAARYFDEHPEHATDERLAETFRLYVERIRAVPTPPAH